MGILDSLKATYAPHTLLWAWGAVFVSFMAIHAVELLWPAERGQSYRSIGFNSAVALVYLVLDPAASFLPSYVATAIVQAARGSWFAFDLPAAVSAEGGLTRVALLALFGFVPLFVFDFFYYWFHRLQHTSTWLCHQHKLHHTDEAVNVTTSLRHHWTEDAFRAILIGIPMGVLFKITPVQAGIVTMFIGQWGYLIHANVRMRLGPLTYVLNGPQAHRIHHSRLPEHYNKNFAAFFPIWDILFWTFHHPRSEFPATGVAGEASRPPMRDVLFWPFMAWLTMTGEALRELLSERAQR
jgi:sterol desaturase/sphingolipid hydroxylase (fatty acid hydroxylase superfamily)